MTQNNTPFDVTFNADINEQLNQVIKWYAQGEIFAYPTEAVYGLGCDPQNRSAVYQILEAKNRPVEKGMILIASDFKQLEPYVMFDKLSNAAQKKILQTWPGPVTWLLPKSQYTPEWVSGESEMVAVRVTAHPLVGAMCNKLKNPIISTSANPASKAPAKSFQQVEDYFGQNINIVKGELGQQNTPSQIFHGITMETIRA